MICGLSSLQVSTSFAQNTLDLAGLTAASPATVAFSMRKLSSTYSGPAIQVRRSGDNLTQDIGFNAGGELNITALMTFVGSVSGYISTWYDQSGNGRHLTQGSLNNQPRIVNAGTMDLENNRPFIRFFKQASNPNYLALPAAINQVGMVSTVNKYAVGGRGFLLGHSTTYYWHDAPPFLIRNDNNASLSVRNSTVYQNGKQTTGTSAVFNTSLMVNHLSPADPTNGTSWDNIGRDRTIYNHTSLGSGYTELIVFPVNPTNTERRNFEKNQGIFYNIPIAGYFINRFGAYTTSSVELINRHGGSSGSGVMLSGQTVSTALPSAPTTSKLALDGSSASLQVDISNFDGANSTAGICWGTTANPTISSSKTTVTISASPFTTSMTGLVNGTTYFVRSYVTNGLGTTYGNEYSFTHVSPGYAYGGGVVGYVYKPGDPGYVQGEVHGIIAATADLTASGAFGCNGTNITGAEGAALGTGRVNTDNILLQCATAGIASRVAANHSGGGNSDWFLPSIDELAALYPNRALIGGFSTSVNYWSSTEGTDDPGYTAKIVLFNLSGDISDYSKNSSNPRVRAVRYF